ncbi:NTP transferase domain-containing protein [Marinomonas ostreistagni]|uniref:NTP transferase domain-containing protein n=1 Tax=Marinomonas ostreistagni TaxID=359209 RepID=UPI001951DCFF|nr:NTP transferase domain-containing protein [Marinomonas ostreistagni]
MVVSHYSDITLTAVILAGGEGQRMGGVDKGLQIYQGRPLVHYMLSLAGSLSESLVISANRNLDRYRQMADCVVPDDECLGGVGPLGGLLAVLGYVHSSHMLVLPCDTPKLSRAALVELIASAEACSDKIHYLSTVSGSQPLHAILPVASLQASLRAFLHTAEHHGVMKFYREIGCHAVHWDVESEFDNFNYSHQLQAAK